jgi:hypothetical protein
MMEGTANYVARVAVGQHANATAARLRTSRDAEAIRWRFYDSGAAICLLLDRFQPDWKTRVDGAPESTTAGILEAAVERTGVSPSAFSATDMARFEERAAADVAALSARQSRLRDELTGRPGPRVVIEIVEGADPLRVERFDPINLLVLDAGEMAHANYITLAGAPGTIEVTNPGFARDSFAGTVALTRGAGRHPLGDGIRTLTVAGLKSVPTVVRGDTGVVTLEADGLRVTLRGAEARTDGETVRISVVAVR